MTDHTHAGGPDHEQAIRALFDDWQRASAEGNIARLRELIDEDVVFLTPGQPPMRGRDAFAAGFAQVIAQQRIESHGRIVEVQIAGDWAYCWSMLEVTVTPRQGGPATRRSGNTLTIMRRQPEGHWAILRDANLLTVVNTTATAGAALD